MYIPPGVALSDIVVISDGKFTGDVYNKITMQTKNSLLNKLKAFFIPPGVATEGAFKEVIPFFAMMTVVLGWMYIVFVQQIEGTLWVATFTILMFVHLVIYWSVFNFVEAGTKMAIYFVLQGVLAMAMVLIVGDIGLIIALYGSLIGNTVGLLHKTRWIILVIGSYLVVAVIGILYLTGADELLSWAGVALPALLFSGFIASLFRRQLDARERTQNLLEELQEAHKKLEAYTNQVEELTRSAERQRMARELHDTLAQGLAGLILKLEAVSTHVNGGNNARAQEILQDAMAQSRTTLSEARMVIEDLRSENSGGQSFEKTIRAEVKQFEQVAGIPCEVIIRHKRVLPEEVRQHALKIISEGLNNVTKHARASQAWLRVIETDTTCKIEIEDNGRGFLMDEAFSKEGSYGLLGIQERVDLLQGKVAIESTPGDGTCLTVNIPLPAEVSEYE